MNLGDVILGVVVTLIIALVSILIGGVIDAQMRTIFTQLNVNATWRTLLNTAVSYSQTAITFTLIAVLITAIMVIVFVVKRFL